MDMFTKEIAVEKPHFVRLKGENGHIFNVNPAAVIFVEEYRFSNKCRIVFENFGIDMEESAKDVVEMLEGRR